MLKGIYTATAGVCCYGDRTTDTDRSTEKADLLRTDHATHFTMVGSRPRREKRPHDTGFIFGGSRYIRSTREMTIACAIWLCFLLLRQKQSIA